jgi:hypothetical protein
MKWLFSLIQNYLERRRRAKFSKDLMKKSVRVLSSAPKSDSGLKQTILVKLPQDNDLDMMHITGTDRK